MSNFQVVRNVLVGAAALIVAGLLAGRCPAQRPLYEREPFDRITLNEANESRVLEVLPLPFPGRRVPASPRASDKIKVELLSEPGTQYEIAWRDIASVELFEQMLLGRARQLTAQRQFDEAFDYFAELRQRFPETPDLTEALQDYLFLNAGHYFRTEKQPAVAMTILEDLYKRNPNYRYGTSTTVAAALNSVSEAVIGEYLAEDDLEAAQRLLTRYNESFPDLPVVAKLSGQLASRAAVKRDEARAHLEAGRLREAHVAVRRMLEIWPAVEGGRQLAVEVERRYPLVAVGVSNFGSEHQPKQLDNWAARRTGRLRHRLLMEIVGPGPEGGQYRCPLGTAAQSEDRRRLTIQLSQSEDAGNVTGYDVAHRLLEMADTNSPQYVPDWGMLMSGARVRDVYGVEANLRRPHVLPESLLQVFLNPEDASRAETEPSNGPYVVAERTEEQVRFMRSPDYALGQPTQPAEIVERRFADPNLAIEALERGEIDLIDRLLPADAERLKQNSSLVVRRYALPSVHVLIPNFDRPYTNNVTFRRALVYGIRRDAVLQQLVLGGQDIAGCRVVSGPFPAGIGEDDPLAYAYDPAIEWRRYNPRLAAALTRLAQFELREIAKKKKEPPPELGTLVLAHPDDFLTKAVCEVIVQQLDAVGIKCQLKALPPGETRDSSGDYDLLYAELAVWEPLTDVRRLFADDGLVASGNPYISLALRRLDTATNWKEAAQLLHELHFIAHNEVMVVPLWQLVDHFAHHPRLRSLGDENVSLYQNVEQWQVAPRTGRE